MVRLFSLLSAFAVLMILTAGTGVYWISKAGIAQSKQDSVAAVAKGVALSLSAQIDLLNRTLDKMAQDPEVLAAVASADPAVLAAVAAKLEKHLPDVLKIRLFLPGASELDDKSVPRMGYADLDMVRETFTKNQLPAVQGDGPDRHLAMTRRIMQNDQAVGVILASLNYNFIAKSVQAAAVKEGYIELRQAALALGAVGEKIDAEQSDNAQIAVANTGWELHYYYAEGASSGEFIGIVGMMVVPGLLALLAFFVGQRKLSGLLAQDMGYVLKAVKDLMANKLQGTYPVKLTEMNAVISTLVQYKRVLDNDIIINKDNDIEPDDFFGGSDDF